MPPANATIVTRMLLVKISLENAASSSVDSPRSVPRRGSVTDRYSDGTTPPAAAGAVVHERAGARDQRFEPGDGGVAGEPPAREGEVGRAGPVQRAEPAHAVGPQGLGAPPGPSDQRVELGPSR